MGRPRPKKDPPPAATITDPVLLSIFETARVQEEDQAKLHAFGIETAADLAECREADLVEAGMKVFQARKLIKAAQSPEEETNLERVNALFKRMFDAADTDKSGALDAKEIKDVLGKIANVMEPHAAMSREEHMERVRAFICQFDSDGDGVVTYEEFMDVFTRDAPEMIAWFEGTHPESDPAQFEIMCTVMGGIATAFETMDMSGFPGLMQQLEFLNDGGGGSSSFVDGILTLPDGQQLYVNPDGWAGVAQPNTCTNTDDNRRKFTYMDGILTLPDGQQLYVCPNGWAGVAQPNTCTNTDDNRRKFTNMAGIFTLPDGRQLYVNPKGWAGVARANDHTNTDDNRRKFEAVVHTGYASDGSCESMEAL